VVLGYDKHLGVPASPRSGGSAPPGGGGGGSGRFDAKAFVKHVAAHDRWGPRLGRCSPPTPPHPTPPHPTCTCTCRSCHALVSQVVQGIAFFSFVEEQSAAGDPYEWYARALPHMSPDGGADQELGAGAAGAGGREPVSIAPPRRGLLQPPQGCVHRWGHARGPGGARRRS
jgi:hypothetical protein